jgi:hypothetical protein
MDLRTPTSPPWSRAAARCRRRRGATAAGAIGLVALAASLMAAAMIFRPFRAAAVPAPAQRGSVTAAASAHQAVIDLLASVVTRSSAVLAVHERGATPYVEIVLWIEDGAGAGRIDAREVAVISHSAVLRTVWLAQAIDDSGPHRADPLAQPAPPLSSAEASSPEFPAAFRARPDVQRRLIATEVADLALVRHGDRLRLTLTWGADSADGADEAAVLFEAPRGAP